MQGTDSYVVPDSPCIQPAPMQMFLHLALAVLVESVRALYSFLLPGLHKETDVSRPLSHVLKKER